MDKPDQNNLSEEASASAEPELPGESSVVKPGRVAEDSAKRPEIQAKPAPKVAVEEAILPKISQMQLNVEDLLREKEQLMLGFVFAKVPKPYYVRWKEETNAIFAQVVAINTRFRAIKARKAAEQAKAAKKAG